ncbi:MAG: carbohydrate porin, partial [Bdellovibrio sp.]
MNFKKHLLAAFAVVLFTSTSWAEDAGPCEDSDHFFSVCEGSRLALAEKGVTFDIVYKGEWNRVVAGGVRKKDVYIENFDLKLSLDGEKLVGLPGSTLFIYGLGDRGSSENNSPSNNAGDLQGLSNIETSEDKFILYELWYEQNLFGWLSLLGGLHDLNSDFYVTEASGLFFNSSFGIGNELAQTGLNGPSIFPVTSTALRARADIGNLFSLQAGAFNAQAGDPQHSQTTHIRSFGDDGTLFIAEFTYQPGDEDNRGKYTIGSWMYDRKFEHLLRNEYNKSHGTYFLINQTFAKDYSVFFRYGFTTTETNPVAANWSTGFVMNGPFASRPLDTCGIALTEVILGDTFKDHLALDGIEAADRETVYE